MKETAQHGGRWTTNQTKTIGDHRTYLCNYHTVRNNQLIKSVSALRTLLRQGGHTTACMDFSDGPAKYILALLRAPPQQHRGGGRLNCHNHSTTSIPAPKMCSPSEHTNRTREIKKSRLRSSNLPICSNWLNILSPTVSRLPRLSAPFRSCSPLPGPLGIGDPRSETTLPVPPGLSLLMLGGVASCGLLAELKLAADDGALGVAGFMVITSCSFAGL